MKVLLDECVPARFAAYLAGHSVKTSPSMGWAGIRNGALLELAKDQFDVLVTVDRNLSFQQDLRTLPIAVIVMKSHSNKVEVLAELADQVVSAIESIDPCSLKVIG